MPGVGGIPLANPTFFLTRSADPAYTLPVNPLDSMAAEPAIVPASPDLIEGAGGIVERSTLDGPLIAVVRRRRYGTEWALPKGKKKSPDESFSEAALREVHEETGLSPTLVALAGATAYVANGRPKLVVYWRMSVEKETPFVPNDETVELEWLPPADAVGKLSHPDQSGLVADVYGLSVAPAPAAATSRIWSRWSTRGRRLASEVDAYRLEVMGRARLQRKFVPALPAILPLLTRAHQAQEKGDIDRGWKYLHTARRMELLVLDDDSLRAAAATIHEEAEKLEGWRKNAVVGLVTRPAGVPADIFRAATIRDEHYDNQAYKDALRRDQAVRLAFVLAGVLLVLFYWVGQGALDGGDWARVTDAAGVKQIDLFKAMVSVGIFGLLGAAISAILAVPDARGTTRIPEMASTLRVTLLRLFMGPAAAILFFVVCQSKVATDLFRFETIDAYTVLAVAFVAGTSERLVLRVVETIAGTSSVK
jgi:8-oxo-dGTP diphosphatase